MHIASRFLSHPPPPPPPRTTTPTLKRSAERQGELINQEAAHGTLMFDGLPVSPRKVQGNRLCSFELYPTSRDASSSAGSVSATTWKARFLSLSLRALSQFSLSFFHRLQTRHCCVSTASERSELAARSIAISNRPVGLRVQFFFFFFFLRGDYSRKLRRVNASFSLNDYDSTSRARPVLLFVLSTTIRNA